MLLLHPPALFFISSSSAAAATAATAATVANSFLLSFPVFIHCTKINYAKNKIHCFNSKQQLQLVPSDRLPKSDVISDTIRLLEWSQLCDHVSSFAGTPLGREATKSKLLSMSLSYEESERLLEETTAAIELIDYGAGLDFAGVDVNMVKLGIERVSRGYSVNGLEAIAVVCLIQLAQTLQSTLQTAIKADKDNYNRFMPLSKMIMDAIISQSLVKFIQQVIDDDGSVKDSASPELRRYRDQVRTIDRKLSQVMEKLTREHASQYSSMEVCSVNGRWCIKIVGDKIASLEGLLMSSRLGGSSYIEPIVSVQLNDQLQEARVLVAKAEEDVLSKLSDQMLVELDHIQNLLQIVVQLDIITARAKYSIAYDGTIPELYQPGVLDMNESNNSANKTLNKNSVSGPPRREWKLYIPKAYHPLLLKKHRENLNNAKKDVSNAIADTRRLRLQGNTSTKHDDVDVNLASLKLKVAALEKDPPVPIDFVVSTETTVLVITGPNTGGKTISLKTVGMVSLMAKAGLYVIASEPVKIPWFDAIFADIGDEQSLTQSLSTFSGHIRQINAIRSQSTSKSLVLLDEIGAGTNPLEGAALGMSLLESFAEYGSFLTIATTHHGELKTLKYSNKAFENACVEFDEDSLKPTYKILWGIPGRSNAINIAERLGLPCSILDNARKLYGTSGAEINQVIVDMEGFKQDLQQSLQTSEHYLMLSRKLHDDLVIAKQKITEYSAIQKNKRREAILHSAAIARSILRKRMQQFRESLAVQKAHQITSKTDKSVHSNVTSSKLPLDPIDKIASSSEINSSFGNQNLIPKIGDMVMIISLGKKAQVLKVDVSKGEITVLASNMKLRLKLNDVNVEGRTS